MLSVSSVLTASRLVFGHIFIFFWTIFASHYAWQRVVPSLLTIICTFFVPLSYSVFICVCENLRFYFILANAHIFIAYINLANNCNFKPGCLMAYSSHQIARSRGLLMSSISRLPCSRALLAYWGSSITFLNFKRFVLTSLNTAVHIFFCSPLGSLPVVGPTEGRCCLWHLVRPYYVLGCHILSLC